MNIESQVCDLNSFGVTDRPFSLYFSLVIVPFKPKPELLGNCVSFGRGQTVKIAMESKVSPEILAERLSEAVSALQQATSDNMVRPPDC